MVFHKAQCSVQPTGKHFLLRFKMLFNANNSKTFQVSIVMNNYIIGPSADIHDTN